MGSGWLLGVFREYCYMSTLFALWRNKKAETQTCGSRDKCVRRSAGAWGCSQSGRWGRGRSRREEGVFMVRQRRGLSFSATAGVHPRSPPKRSKQNPVGPGQGRGLFM